MKRAVCCVLCAVCCVLCAVCRVLCAVCCVLCAVCCVLNAVPSPPHNSAGSLQYHGVQLNPTVAGGQLTLSFDIEGSGFGAVLATAAPLSTLQVWQRYRAPRTSRRTVLQVVVFGTPRRVVRAMLVPVLAHNARRVCLMWRLCGADATCGWRGRRGWGGGGGLRGALCTLPSPRHHSPS